MEYGCIGEKLRHSFSKEIHSALADYSYDLVELAKDEVDKFFENRQFKAINVTIPYKETALPHLDYISDEAKQIGAVNTVVNKDGKLYGYNTDFFGMLRLAERMQIEVQGKTVAVLGSGGTSKTATAVSAFLGAKQILKVSRTPKESFITYEALYAMAEQIDVIINTTPVGMYPEIYKSPVDVNEFVNLSGVIDAVYNPLCSKLVTDAENKGIKASGGLYMLVAQAALAVEKFIDVTVSNEKIDAVYNSLLKAKENIVLIGMPSAGKTTVGKLLAKELGKEFFDSDVVLEKNQRKTIPEIFKEKGEAYFRELEKNTVFMLAQKNSAVIATGGGVILNGENIEMLKENGKIIFLDRPLNLLFGTNDRPLSKNKADVEKLYNERYDKYKACADFIIDASGSLEETVNKILKVSV